MKYLRKGKPKTFLSWLSARLCKRRLKKAKKEFENSLLLEEKLKKEINNYSHYRRENYQLEILADTFEERLKKVIACLDIIINSDIHNMSGMGFLNRPQYKIIVWKDGSGDCASKDYNKIYPLARSLEKDITHLFEKRQEFIQKS